MWNIFQIDATLWGKKWSASSDQSSYATRVQEVHLGSMLRRYPLGASLGHLSRGATQSPSTLTAQFLTKESTSFPGYPSQNQTPRRRSLPRRMTRRTHALLEDTCSLASLRTTLSLQGSRSCVPTFVHPTTPLAFVLREVDLWMALTVLFILSMTSLPLLLHEVVARPTHPFPSRRAPQRQAHSRSTLFGY